MKYVVFIVVGEEFRCVYAHVTTGKMCREF